MFHLLTSRYGTFFVRTLWYTLFMYKPLPPTQGFIHKLYTLGLWCALLLCCVWTEWEKRAESVEMCGVGTRVRHTHMQTRGTCAQAHEKEFLECFTWPLARPHRCPQLHDSSTCLLRQILAASVKMGFEGDVDGDLKAREWRCDIWQFYLWL